MPRELSEIAHIVEILETQLKEALDQEELNLLEEEALLRTIYEGVSGEEFTQKAPTEKTVLFMEGFLSDFCPTLYATLE